MRICALCVMALLMVPSLSAAQEKAQFEDTIKQMLETMDSLSTLLATVRDEETAKSSQAPLRKAAEKWHAIKKNADGLPPPPKEEKDRLAKQYRMKLEEAQKKLFGEVARVRSVRGGPEALLEISGVLDKKSKQDTNEKRP